jgi:aquaglyceroporin related protein
MSVSPTTAYSHSSNSNRMTPMSEVHYGSGPGLVDPDDEIQNSDAAYKNHLDKAADSVGAGPTVRRPSTVPSAKHIEYRQHTLDLQNGSQNRSLERTTTSKRENTARSFRSKSEIEHLKVFSTIRTRIGLESEPPIVEGHHVHEQLAWSSIRYTLREPFAEFFGTFIMVLFGDASVAQVLLSAGETTAPGGGGFGPYQSISWGWAP